MTRWIASGVLVMTGVMVIIQFSITIGLLCFVGAVRMSIEPFLSNTVKRKLPIFVNGVVVVFVGILLITDWAPAGIESGFWINALIAVTSIGGILFLFTLFVKKYTLILHYFLEHKKVFLIPVGGLVLCGVVIWFGFFKVFFFFPNVVYKVPLVNKVAHAFPGLGKEFMPPLDEGSYLYMPTTMVHASIGEVHDIMHKQNIAISNIAEVENAVGKLGRVESALDPAPVSMIETIITLKSEFRLDANGERGRYRFKGGEFVRDKHGDLIPDPFGRPFRQWRDTFVNQEDIWNEIVSVAQVPGVTSAPELQPIAARIVMLQSGMRAPMGIKIKGPSLQRIESFGLTLEKLLKEVPSVNAPTVFADRIVGKPYLEIHIDREAIARYGIHIDDIQRIINISVGGYVVSHTVEGRERYAIRVRYLRERRGLGKGILDIEKIMVPTATGSQIPMKQLATINYRQGPQMIKSEDTFLTGYVLFDKKSGYAEVDVVNEAREYLETMREQGTLTIPPGISYAFAGSYENQVRSERRLRLILPVALIIIFIILYFQFRTVSTTMLVFSGIVVAWSGGFVLLWLYGQDWFLSFPIIGDYIRNVFQIHPVNLSVAVWVGFLALFGIATDDAVVMCTYLTQKFNESKPQSRADVRKMVVSAASRRVRPALMTSATTILALLPILTATGRGGDVMIPMAIPSFGGMIFELLTIFMAPVLFSMIEEVKFRKAMEK